MHAMYTYIPETNYVPTEYSGAAILLLLFMVLILLVSVLDLLYFYISTFQCMCAVPNMAVFCSSLTSCFPGMLRKYLLLLLLLLLWLLYDMDVSCHRLFLHGSSLEPTVNPNAHASSFTLQYFPYYV